MAKSPYVDQESCTGCETCIDLCPGVFRLTDDMTAEAFDPAGATEEEIQEAIDSCPVECISWVEE
jgi:ferredoxin